MPNLCYAYAHEIQTSTPTRRRLLLRLFARAHYRDLRRGVCGDHCRYDAIGEHGNVVQVETHVNISDVEALRRSHDHILSAELEIRPWLATVPFSIDDMRHRVERLWRRAISSPGLNPTSKELYAEARRQLELEMAYHCDYDRITDEMRNARMLRILELFTEQEATS